MPKAAKTAVAVAEPEEAYDYTTYLEKAPTDLQSRFAAWIIEQTGMQFGTKKEQAAFEEGVRLATALRMHFQRSPENQEVLTTRRAEAGDRELAAAKETAPPRKSAAKKAAAAAPVAPAKKAVPAKKVAKAAAPVEPTASDEEVVTEPAQGTRRPPRRPIQRRAATTAATEEEAPF